MGRIDDTKMDAAETVNLNTGDSLSPPSRVGAELRIARERLSLDLGFVAQRLRIREEYLAAIENGAAAGLPAAYAMGFVRSYANLLGLPAENLCRRFREELGAASLRPEVVFPAPIRARGVSLGAVALITIVLAVVGYAGWYKMSENRPGEVASVPPVPERLAPLAEPAQSSPPAVVAAAKPEVDLPSGDSDQPAAGQTSGDGQAVTPSEAAAIGVSNPAANYEQAAGTAATSRIMLHANADSWLQVHDGSGNLLFSRILRTGESWQVPAGAGTLYLTTGNAGGTDVLVDGRPTPSLGGFGVVRHDLPLDPDQVKAGKLVAPG